MKNVTAEQVQLRKDFLKPLSTFRVSPLTTLCPRGSPLTHGVGSGILVCKM